MTQKNLLLVNLIVILVVYSSEITFMPNYTREPDQWHLFLPMLAFNAIILILLIWNSILMFKARKINWSYTILSISTLTFFALMNSPKGNSPEIGFTGLLMILLVLIGMNLFYRQGRNQSLPE